MRFFGDVGVEKGERGGSRVGGAVRRTERLNGAAEGVTATNCLQQSNINTELTIQFIKKTVCFVTLI